MAKRVESDSKISKPRGSSLRVYLRVIGAIVWKDIAAELRNRQMISAMLVFALLVVLIFNFALELDIVTRDSVTSGVLWVTFAFAGTLGLNRSAAMEEDRGCLDGLLLVPIDRSALYFGKVIGNVLFLLIVEAIILPLYSVLYNVNLFVPGLLLVIVLGSWGYVAVGTLMAAMALQTRMRDVLLPILLFPVVLPVLIPALKASNAFLQAFEVGDIMLWINLLIAYDLIFTTIAFLVFEYVVEE